MGVTLYKLHVLVLPALNFQRYADKKHQVGYEVTLRRFMLFIARIFVHFVRYPKRTPLIIRYYPSLHVARIQHLNNALILRMSGVVPSPRHTRIEWL